LYDEPLVGVNYARAANITLSEARRVMDQSLVLGPGRSPAAIDALRRMASDIADDLRIIRQRVRDVAVISAIDSAEQSIGVWFRSGTTVLAPPPDGVVALPMPAVIERQSAAANARLAAPMAAARVALAQRWTPALIPTATPTPTLTRFWLNPTI
jgi:hypothetical protein